MLRNKDGNIISNGNNAFAHVKSLMHKDFNKYRISPWKKSEIYLWKWALIRLLPVSCCDVVKSFGELCLQLVWPKVKWGSLEAGPWLVFHVHSYLALFSWLHIFACSSRLSHRWSCCISKIKILLCSKSSLIYKFYKFKTSIKQIWLFSVVNLHFFALFSTNAYSPH